MSHETAGHSFSCPVPSATTGGLQCVRENSPFLELVPKGRLKVAQDKVLGFLDLTAKIAQASVWPSRGRLLRLLPVGLRLPRIVGYILPLKNQLDRRTELLVVGIAHNLPDADILAHIPTPA
jgi:hypothetical protein